jgi:hypothetical protein
MSQEHVQDQVYKASISDPEAFWSRQAENLHWHKKPTKAFTKSTKHLKKSNVSHDHWGWFIDGEISTTYNCADRHVLAGNGENVAIVWDSPVTRQTEQVSADAPPMKYCRTNTDSVPVICSTRTNSYLTRSKLSRVCYGKRA